ncbi:MAG: hypothetical protein EYC70_02330 [Planctomycetota bacterium]|nr:MAG: hypothetical protein EYC70_02330 [Planctomycetota bacterium]
MPASALPTSGTLARRALTRWRLGHRRGGSSHRYFWYRIAAFALIHALIAVVPLSGLLRFDFWRGNHLWLGQPASFLETLRRFLIPFGLANVAIVLVVRWSGRYLCGWVCPVNFMNRWGDWLRGFLGAKDARLGPRGHAMAAATALLFASVFLLWFVDPAVYWEGTPPAVARATAAWLGLAALSYAQIAWLSWRTCRSLCPSGVYFSVLGSRTRTGIERSPGGSPCADCGLCVTTCPMDLDPRDLLGQARAPRGIYFETQDNSSLCIRCGDCVEACERFFTPRGLPPTLRLGVLRGSGGALPAPAPGAASMPAARP